MRDHGLVADAGGEAKIAKLLGGAFASRGQSTGERRDAIEEREPIGKRKVFAKRDGVDFVVSGKSLALRVDEQGTVEAVWSVAFVTGVCEIEGVDTQE